MSRYFTIMTGLRGCYMPDNAFTFKVDTRRELKEIIAYEADTQSCEGAFVGLNKKAVAWASAHAWKKGSKGAILPFGRRGENNKPFSIEVTIATRQEYLMNQED